MEGCRLIFPFRHLAKAASRGGLFVYRPGGRIMRVRNARTRTSASGSIRARHAPASLGPGRDDGLLKLHRLCARLCALAFRGRIGDDGHGLTMGWPNGWRNLPQCSQPAPSRCLRWLFSPFASARLSDYLGFALKEARAHGQAVVSLPITGENEAHAEVRGKKTPGIANRLRDASTWVFTANDFAICATGRPERTKRPDLTDKRTKRERAGAILQARQTSVPFRRRPSVLVSVTGII